MQGETAYREREGRPTLQLELIGALLFHLLQMLHVAKSVKQQTAPSIVEYTCLPSKSPPTAKQGRCKQSRRQRPLEHSDEALSNPLGDGSILAHSSFAPPLIWGSVSQRRLRRVARAVQDCQSSLSANHSGLWVTINGCGCPTVPIARDSTCFVVIWTQGPIESQAAILPLQWVTRQLSTSSSGIRGRL